MPTQTNEEFLADLARHAEALGRLARDPQVGRGTWSAMLAEHARFIADWWNGRLAGLPPETLGPVPIYQRDAEFIARALKFWTENSVVYYGALRLLKSIGEKGENLIGVQQQKEPAPPKPIAEVRSCCGRFCLFVAGVTVAMQGDKCRDADLLGTFAEYAESENRWSEALLRAAAAKINCSDARPADQATAPAT